jgi:hypothetical protein
MVAVYDENSFPRLICGCGGLLCMVVLNGLWRMTSGYLGLVIGTTVVFNVIVVHSCREEITWLW